MEHVEAHDNFFDIGGHSLLAMRMIALIEERTGVHFNPLSISQQTLGQMAVVLDRASADAGARAEAVQDASAPPTRPESDTVVEFSPEQAIPASEYKRLLRKVATRWSRKLRGMNER